jgi:hypothetical protein
VLAAINFATAPTPTKLPAELPARATLVISADPDGAEGEVDLSDFVLAPSEGVLLRLL